MGFGTTGAAEFATFWYMARMSEIFPDEEDVPVEELASKDVRSIGSSWE